ncbi:glycoside hydrolase family 35 protein [Cellulomonas marina]|uniref:Beta-galactosidase n=1 Tax=Cellulomonas marina TaxID=988821 RepID=A0A1I1ADG7_9CELL|nr:beta-galactosidase family protein [Cellulomonas marina]GIG29711.1 beta-galactosidase [Cellulomonas marina]SFB36045.1 beta-galactosidase [Cellulomonas marina]
MTTFTIGEHDFLEDGRPVRLLSGALHFTRIHPGHWRDRVRTARLMGLDTIETYVMWNEHAPTPDRFDTDGRLDLVAFLRVVQDEGMRAIVRPGPYVCAEFDNGGLPAWLTADPQVGLRRREPRFMAAVERYLRQVYALVAPLQVDRGGPVVLVQVENEYGAYGDDHDYLRELVRITRDAGITVPLTSIDQPEPEMLRAGSVPELHSTGSFGSRAVERLATLRAAQPTGPLMCAEFWCGWFDHWGAHHHTTDAAASAAELDALLAAGASVNVYMVHGGTSFGLTSGANDKGVYQPTLTSYDYDAPIDEAGRPTEKFWRFREVIARYAPVPDEVPEPAKPAPETSAPLRPVVGLLAAAERLAPWRVHDEDGGRTTGTGHRGAGVPPTHDDLGHWRGFVAYRTTLTGGDGPAVLRVAEVRDRAQVLLDGAPVGVLHRDHHDTALVLPRGHGELTVLVEDQGRVNYGPRLGEPKGLVGPVRLDGAPVGGWSTLAVDHDGLVGVVHGVLREGPAAAGGAPAAADGRPLAGPVLARAELVLDEPADLFLDTRGWGKGLAWVNGFALGRYWSRGPQRTLYVPGPATRAGVNELVVLELGAADAVARTLAWPDLGHTEQ